MGTKGKEVARAAVVVALLAATMLAGCGGVVLRTSLYCRLTGATARYELRLPPSSPFNAEGLAAVQSCLSGNRVEADISVRRLAVLFLLEVTDAANSSRGRITGVKGPSGRHFWSPTPYFTWSPNGDSWSVAGLRYPLFSLEPVRPDLPFRWRKTTYLFFREAARAWLERTSSKTR